MEYLDYYDEQGTYLGSASREEVHQNGWWHNTIHCWLYDHLGNIYFQIRKDTSTLYTTASGHVLKNETIKEAFCREIKEEIGLELNTDSASLVEVVPWKMDKVKKDGTIWKDRAKAHVYINELKEKDPVWNFDLNEVLGVVKMSAQEVVSLLENKTKEIKGIKITTENGFVKEEEIPIKITDFLVTENETPQTKYGKILKKVIFKTKEKESLN